jgi:serine/threonine protein kinase
MSNDIEILAKSQWFTLKGETVVCDVATDNKNGLPRTPGLHPTNQVIDQKYKIISLLGEGGMGTVYKAHHLSLNKDVALKTFRSPSLTDDSLKRFQREAQAIARLTHQNIVQVFDFGVDEDNVPYYTMEYLSGESLADRLDRQGHLSVEETLSIFLQVCAGLSLAHNKGIIHRDLKPANIFLSKEASGSRQSETVKIVDFGVAGLASDALGGQKLTKAGTIFGSPLYMSPEQSLGSLMTERSDIYSCGCALFETLTGKPPFRGNNALATMLQHQSFPAPALKSPSGEKDFPPGLIALLAGMLTKEADKRIQSFEEVSVRLEEALQYSKSGHSTGHKDSSPPAALTIDSQFEDKERTSQKTNRTNRLLLPTMICLIIVIAAAMGYWKMMPATHLVPTGTHLVATAPPEGSVGVRPYLQNPPANWLQRRRFVFPDEMSLGLLNWDFEDLTGRTFPTISRVKAQGGISVPAHNRLVLTAYDALSDKPNLFDGFGANDLDGLSLDNECSWQDRHIKCISHMTGLVFLDVNDSEATDNCINDLNKLSNLKTLLIKNSHLSGEALASLEILPKLVILDASGDHTIRGALKKLRDSQAIKRLYVHDCDLTDSDMQLIATMSNLEILNLSNNPKLTDLGVEAISRLKTLHDLNIRGTNVCAACIPALAKMQSLDQKKLQIDAQKWSKSDQQFIKDALPLYNMAQLQDNRPEIQD